MVTLLTIIAILAVGIFIFMQKTSFGKEPDGPRLERISKSPNYKDGHFVNQTDTPVSAPNTNMFKLAIQFLFKSSKDTDPDFVLPSVKINLKTEPKSAKPTITYFGHSAYMIQINGKNILMDPVLSERISPVQWAGTKNYAGTHVYESKDLPTIHFIVLSHDHYDHMDYEVLKEFAGKPTKFIVPLGVGAHLEHWGISLANITELDWGDTNTLGGGVSLTATPARHFSGRNFSRGKTLWASYVLLTPEYRIFLGGDSGYEKHFAAIGEKYGPFDLAILECGQYNEMWPFIHMMPEQTAQAGLDLGAKVVWPVHWGKFTLALHPWNESILRMSKKAEELRLRLTTPMIGEQIVIPSKFPNQNWWELQLDKH